MNFGKILRIILLMLFAIYIFGNFSYINKSPILIGQICYFSNNLEFEYCEMYGKGNGKQSFASVKSSFSTYKTNSGCENCTLFRGFKKDWSKFWLHFQYISHPRWKLKYKERGCKVEDSRSLK